MKKITNTKVKYSNAKHCLFIDFLTQKVYFPYNFSFFELETKHF